MYMEGNNLSMRRTSFLKILASYLMIFLFFSEFICSACNTDINFTNMNDMLDFMEFSSKDQKDAFKSICSKADIKIDEKFDETEAMNLVDAMQRKLVNRKDKQERWEVKALDWMVKNEDELMHDLKTLNFLDAVLPKKKAYDAVCVFGASSYAMKKRIEYLNYLMNKGLKAPKIILLTGERYASENVDGTKEELAKISDFFGIKVDKLTEAHIFKYLYLSSSICDYNSELIIIDTPQKYGRRPTTQTTVEDFFKWSKDFPEVKNVLFVSDQPYVKYQKAIVSEVMFSSNTDLNFEVVGNECKSGDIKNFIGVLGSYVWTVMPSCLRHMGIEIKSSTDLAKKLYGHQPWIYNNLPIKN